jgi:hypothetical protein
MRLAGLASLLACLLLLTGCGTESPRQADARGAVQGKISASRYDVGKTRCTDNPSAWFVERETTVFVCAAYIRNGGCDWYKATLRNAGWEVVPDERNAGCVLPF